MVFPTLVFNTPPGGQQSPYEEYERSLSGRFYRWLRRFFPWPWNWLLAPIDILLLLAPMLRLFFFPEEPSHPALFRAGRRSQEIFIILLMLLLFIGFVSALCSWFFK